MNPRQLQNIVSRSQCKFVLLILLVIIFIPIFISCKPTAAPVTRSSPTPPSTAPTLTEAAVRQMLATKESDFAHIAETETAFRQLPAPSQSPVFQSPPMLPTQPVSIAWPTILPGSDALPAGSGVIVVRPSPGFGAPYRIGNQWIEDIHNGRTRIEVEAGVENGPDGLPSAQGIVIVEVWQRSVISNSVAVNRIWEKVYPTPTKAGFVRIVDAVGERLMLRSENSTTFYFDVPSYQFVPSMAWVNRNPISPIPTPIGTAILNQGTLSP